MLAVDPCRMGDFRMGFCRMGVIDPVFDGWKAQGQTESIIRIQRSVAPSSDLYTQHPNITETEVSIDAWVRLGPAGREDLDIGMVGSLDGVLKTADRIDMGDLIQYHGSIYEINTPPTDVRAHGGFLYRVCGLKRMELRR